MARKPDPIPAFYDHYADFTKSLENYLLKSGKLLTVVETVVSTFGDLIDPAVAKRLDDAAKDLREAAYGPRE